MSDAAVVLARALRIVEREARLQLAVHSTLQDLNAYRSGELSPEQESRLQWHLALCFRCADRLLDLERFLEPAAGEEPLDETASWWDLQDRLVRGRMRRSPPPFFMALAAALAPAVAGLLVWNLSLQRELRQPQANVPIESVLMPGTVRAAPEPAEIRLPSRGRFNLTVVPSETLDAVDVRLDILQRSGRLVASVPGMRRSQSDTFDVELPRSRFPNGEYRILLVGRARDGTEIREETTFRIVDL